MVKKKELLLLSCLRSNARDTLTNISKKINMPISTIFDKLKEYEKSFICKHTTLMDFKQLGFDIRIHLLLKVNRDKRSSFENFVMNAPSVNNVYRINNLYDYFVEAIFKNISDFQVFADSVESFGVTDIAEHFVVEELKRESFMSEKINLPLIN